MDSAAQHLEWLETNRRGSFALGCVDRRLRRKYHGLLTVRDPGRGDPWSVLAEVSETLHYEGAALPIVSPLNTNDPDSAKLLAFDHAPHAMHRYRVDGIIVERRVRLAPNHDQVELSYRLRGLTSPAVLKIEPLIRARPIHDLMVENPFLDGAMFQEGRRFAMTPYAGMPSIAFESYGADASFRHHGMFHKGIHYEIEAARGYPADEDLFSPGTFELHIPKDGEVTFVIALDRTIVPEDIPFEVSPGGLGATLERACGQFLMHERSGRAAMIAGYPWFGPYARDTLIALPGLHLALEDLDTTTALLDSLLDERVGALIPATFVRGQKREASLDATLLFIRAVQWLSAHEGPTVVERFMPAVCDALEALADDVDPRFQLVPGQGVFIKPGPWALSWMDVTVNGHPVTPRHGHAVDIDALAYHALSFAQNWAEKHAPERARKMAPLLKGFAENFVSRFYDANRGSLADNVNGEYVDARMRPNQLWAVALPFSPLTPVMKASVLEKVSSSLLTPAGLRSLAAHDVGYRGRYAEPVSERDQNSHQGTVWPWLLGIFSDAVLSVHGRSALEQQVGPCLSFFLRHALQEGCIGQINELFDGDAPHGPGGTPAQAWSACELYRVWRMLHGGN